MMASVAEALLFDMDGVLVDVSASFREAIREVVSCLSGSDVSPAEIQALKEAGGFNDDVRLSAELLARRGLAPALSEVRALFDDIYQGGNGRPGLWRRERWLVPPATLERLSGARRLGVVTGRNRAEVELARRLAPGAMGMFGCVVTQEDVSAGKPAPDGILLAATLLRADGAAYVGDSVDDMRAARAAGARAIGVLPPGTGAGSRLGDLLIECGADVVLRDVSELEDHL
jgi:HAD superfamily phosphatase